jgi:dihydropteroate synthase
MFTLNCKGKMIVFEKPAIMGILNINDDSFYAGSQFNDIETIVLKVKQMMSEGVDIIDIGGQSTRPGSERISAEEELKRVLPVVTTLAKKYEHLLISIDTYHSEVAKQTVASGASIVNDISAGEMDKNMIDTVASLDVPYICMHIKGVPENMHENIYYENIITEVLDFFIQKIDQCKAAGIKDIIIDPGFGFGKSIQHNFKLLKNLSLFKMLGKPILAGISRKSTVYKTLNISAEESLNGTTVLNTIALQNGTDILRVHDVKEAREIILLLEAIGKV